MPSPESLTSFKSLNPLRNELRSLEDSVSSEFDGLWNTNVGVGQRRESVGCDKRGPLTVTREPSAIRVFDTVSSFVSSFSFKVIAFERSSCSRHQCKALSAATLPPCANPNR